MEKMEVHILGCGSALPTTRHFNASQVVNVRDQLFMIDCGEGAQLQFRRAKLKFSRLNAVFISHLHGDHCFGLPGLISTLNLLGRTADLHIYAPNELEALMQPWIDFFCRKMTYQLFFHPFDATVSARIYEDRSLTVTSIPLRHRIASAGFLFAEKQTPNHIRRDMVDFYQVPLYELNRIKNGADYLTAEGQLIPNSVLTRPSAPPRRYAYCSDTAYLPHLAEQLSGVDLLYHEATFADADLPRAKETYHSTARQAAELAHAAGARQLLLGHFSARYEDETILLDEARALFPNTLLAKEMLCVPIPDTSHPPT
jgi:ribonuclease Z